MKKKIKIILLILFIIIGVILFFVDKRQEKMPSEIPKNEEKIYFYCEIKGEVENEGVYKMEEGDRVNDLINIAGGTTLFADLKNVNRALKLKGEMLVVIPRLDKSKKSFDNCNLQKLKEGEILVEIKGEVLLPGLYIVSEEMILNDLINIAGGLTNNANTSYLNKTIALKDEMLITIPSIIKEEGKVSINEASVAELMTIEGIGEAKAMAIIEYRERYGFFTILEDLLNVKGISLAIFDKIKDKITL